ncbi:hypothetical protein MHBO_001848 [Bonamia ostreae]|uniref:RGS domain-containing protein n=1 Tax=Bonamia ostreae TaxID=126728 RepID=A0ABV2AKD6_9EUKA
MLFLYANGFMIDGHMFVSYFMIAILTFNKSSQGKLIDNNQLFDRMLTDKNLLQKYYKFLVKEFSAENLSFLQTIAVYKRQYESSKKKHLFDTIFSNFIKKNSRFELNLSDRTKKQIFFAVEKNLADKNVFNKAETEIKDMLRNDSFRRFYLENKMDFL